MRDWRRQLNAICNARLHPGLEKKGTRKQTQHLNKIDRLVNKVCIDVKF